MKTRQLLSNLIIAFLGVSRRMIGHVLFRSQFHGRNLGVGYILALRHQLGMLLRRMHVAIKFFNVLFIKGPRCFSISFVIPEGPAALSKGSCLMILDHSSSEGGIIRYLYMPGLT